MILGVRDGIFEVWVPVMIFSPFIVDATVTLTRRMLRGKKIWEAHREHYYQRVVLSGWSHRRTVLVEYGLMILCGGLAVLYHYSTDRWKLVILGVWVSIFLVLRRLVHKLEGRRTDAGTTQHLSAAGGSTPISVVTPQDSPRDVVKV